MKYDCWIPKQPSMTDYNTIEKCTPHSNCLQSNVTQALEHLRSYFIPYSTHICIELHYAGELNATEYERFITIPENSL